MTSITCKIVDPSFNGIQGIYAQLRCKDQIGNTIFDYEAFTNDDGDILYWFRLDMKDGGAAEIVHGGHFPVISLSFNPGIREHDFPWNSIHTELRMSRVAQHQFVLVLYPRQGTYHLEHAMTPPHEAQMEWEGPCPDQEMINTHPDRSPSPLQLPSPIMPPRAGLIPEATRGVKRKLSSESEENDMMSDGRRSAKRRGITARNKKAAERRMTPDSDDSWASGN